MVTNFQKINQEYGPHLPTVERMIEILKLMPRGLEITAVSIDGQEGQVYLEYKVGRNERVLGANVNK